MYNKFTCLVLCAVTVSLSSVYGEERKCMKEFGVNIEDMKAVMKTGDVSKVDPCYWACYFNAVGLLNDKGQYDQDNYLTKMKKYVTKDKVLAALEDIGQRCISVKDAPVSDGEAGCEMGTLIAACFFTRIQLLKTQNTTTSP